jgi:hypothetical protein
VAKLIHFFADAQPVDCGSSSVFLPLVLVIDISEFEVATPVARCSPQGGDRGKEKCWR